ncbi:MAG: right-handed parallel beta-helix repeat-containing protein, partial [Vallitaleaceae bacterium]|nr:right-handed parallel beta-helix repeat-containing protein [Vallitaleaceae bacterium]
MIRKWQRSMGWVLSIVMMLSLVYVTPIQARGSEALLLNVSQMDNATMTSNTEVNGFLIKAAADKAVVVDASSKTASDGTVFAKRLKLGGTGSADSRSVHFTVTGKSEVKVYAMSSSGDADRELGLFQFDGTEIGTMEAFGAKLESNIFTVSAGDYYLASKSSGVNIYQVEVIPTPEIEVKTLGISSMEIGDLIENTERNGFTLVATADKKITVDANAKTASDGASFSQRLKLNGAGTVSERSVHFSVSAESEVKVYAMSGSSSADRKLGLYRLDDSLVGTMQTLGASLEVTTFSVPAGEFYLASMESGINIYEVIVTTGEPAEIIRKAWNEVAAPVLTGVTQEGNQVHVAFNLITGVDGADKANVYMYDEEGLIVDSIIVGNSLSEQKVASFTIADSGSYEFQVEAVRNEETETKLSGKDTINYLLPLDKPVIRAFNQLDGSILVKWFSVKEAQSYRVEAKVANTSGPSIVVNALSEEAMIPSGELEEGSQYEIKVIALRASDESASESIFKTMKKEAQREWNFTYFGQSVSSSRNVMNMLDEENLRFELKSCTIKPDGVTIDGKGGKFTTFHDGISYYYTVIDPTTENFELTATFHVDYINSTPDGQEGFGLLAMDSIGAYGVSNVNHYTNSAGIIATKFEETIEGVKYTGKDVIGSRFVSGITTEVLNAGDSGIAQAARNQSKGYGYLEDDLVKTGDSYTLTLKKTNTGYHTLYNGEERTLYGVEKLLQLDSEHLYVGFAVARGANVTVSDVRFTTSNPLMDPPAMEEPAEMVSYMKKIDSPTTSGVKDYTFVYVADVPGTLTVLNENGSKLVDEESIQKGIDFTKQFQLQFGVNHYTVKFTPQADYVPGDNQILDSYETVTTEHQVIFRSFPGSSIYVSPTGKDTNSGSSNSPVDLHTAIAYVKAGQTIVLEGGTYEMKSSVVVPRGIDGKENAYIGLRAKADQRAIFDFSQAGGGMSLWGDYWYVENIDITKTPGNVKGLQVAGSHNMIVRVDAYRNGDTGIQISGTGAETIEKWPAHNLILNCTSYDNMDPGQNNADGFAAKITVAEGNIFRGCIAHNNLDDGWDLFAKIESGPIGAVIIENSIAYNNGTLTDGIGNGDGNGFKLGGDGIAVAHVLRNSISYNNNTNGVTSNSNPSAVIENVTSYGNKGR